MSFWYTALTDTLRDGDGIPHKLGEPLVDRLWSTSPKSASGFPIYDTALSPWDSRPQTLYRHVHRVHPIGERVAVGGHAWRTEGAVIGRRLALEELCLHADDDHGAGVGDQIVFGTGTQTLYLLGDAVGHASDCVHVIARGRSVVYAGDRTIVEAFDGCRVIAHGQCRVYAWRHEGTVALFGDAVVSPGPRTRVELLDDNRDSVLPVGASFRAQIQREYVRRLEDEAISHRSPSCFDARN